MQLKRTTILLLGILLSGSLGGASAQTPEGRVTPRTRTPASVMSFRGADWLERPQRPTEERPDATLDVMGLAPGDVVADIGAGSGFFSRRIADLVAPGGTVFAVDVQPEMLDILMERAEEEGLAGIVPVLGEPEDPKLPEGSVDWMLMVDVYHELADPSAMLARMSEALAPSGRVALLEYRVEDASGDHIRAEHRMSVRQAVAEWEASGYRLVELHEFLPSQHLFVFRPLAAGESDPVDGVLAHYDLSAAQRAGLVQVRAAGTGGDAVNLAIRRTRPEAMVVTLPAGAWFETGGPGGDVIARRDAFVLLEDDDAHAWRVPAWLVREGSSPPGAGELLELSQRQDSPTQDLMWLLQGIDLYPAVAATVEQIAVWIATDDAGWEALSAHARSNSVHAANAVALAAVYVNGAGLDIKQRRIWAERELFVPALTDEGLQRIFAELEAN